MNPGFRFDNVDVVVNRNSLRKLLDFCSGRVQDTFRVNLFLVRNSLFIERCERNASQMIRGRQDSGWGRNFEKTFTKFPAPEANGTSHHRVLNYAIGELNCAVRFEVDACYEEEDTADEPTTSSLVGDNLTSLAAAMDRLSVVPAANTKVIQQQAMPQSSAAEIKALAKTKSMGKYLPQLWFGRTPWFIVGRHVDGTFHEVKITDAKAHFVDWETKHQHELQKLVVILTRLREAVRKNGGRNCVAICEKTSMPRAIKIFASTIRRRALPDDSIREFWA